MMDGCKPVEVGDSIALAIADRNVFGMGVCMEDTIPLRPVEATMQGEHCRRGAAVDKWQSEIIEMGVNDIEPIGLTIDVLKHCCVQRRGVDFGVEAQRLIDHGNQLCACLGVA